mgnify:FL=1
MKFKTWRRLWIALAETEMELGLSENGKPVITQEQIDELKAHVDDINYDVAREREKLVRHDVMSHVYAYGQQCPRQQESSISVQLPVMSATIQILSLWQRL